LARYARNAFTFFTASHGLPPGTIRNIHRDRSGRLWLASDGGGLIRVDNTSAEQPTFVSYTTTQGLSSNNTEVITEDIHGRLYVGGAHGLDRFDPATGRVRHFTTADGLAPGIFRAAFRDHNGVLWFGMTGGLSRLAPVIERPPPPPPVLITGLRVSGVTRPVSALGQREMSLLDFAPEHNQLQVDFVGLGFGTGDVLRYQYRLEGAAGTDWSAPDHQRTVTYASLAPGRYRFVVRAMNSEEIVSDDPAPITFRILHPVWLRWWFLTLGAMALGLMTYALYRYRVTRLLAMANMRTRIATDLHDDIGANLTRIALLSEVAKQTRSAHPQTDDDTPLAAITRIARESVSSMSDIVWAINPKRESLLDLIRRMRQHADEIFTLRDIELRFNTPGAADGLRLSMDVRRDLLLIFKEAVNNAARHAQCSHVDIDMRVEGSRMVLTVVDDGIGFDASSESEGQGLTSMQRRAERLSGTLGITSGPGLGTTVRLDMPI
jgi:signal transduction histidine kinase